MKDADEKKGPDRPAAPGKAKREDYVWCAECGGFIFRPLLNTEEPFFAGEPTTTCPAGHALDHVEDSAPPEV